MATPLLTLNSLLPSQSLFNEVQSIHDTGFLHELDSFFCCKDAISAPNPTQVNVSRNVSLTIWRPRSSPVSLEKRGVFLILQLCDELQVKDLFVYHY